MEVMCVCAQKTSHLFFLVCLVDLCEDYQNSVNSVCGSLPGYASRQVLVRKGKTISGQEELEKDMSHLIQSVKYHALLTDGCESFLVMALCHTTFPLCQNGSEDHALDLCSDHCQLLESLETFCPEAYDSYQDYVAGHSALVSSPKCDLTTEADGLCLPLPSPLGMRK